MNGLALGGSHGLFTNPGKSLGRIFSLKNVVPDVTTAVGAAIGGPVGAGLGETAGQLIEGQSFGQAAASGLEYGGIAYGLGGLMGGGGGGAAGGLLGAGGGGSGTILGNEIGALGSELGIGSGVGGGSTGTILGNAINSIGGDLGVGGAGTGAAASGGGTGTLLGTAVNDVGSKLGLGSSTLLGNAINEGGAALGIGGQGGAASGAIKGAVTGNEFSIGGTGAGVGGGASSGLLGKITLPELLSVGGLAASAIRGNQQYPGQAQLSEQAQSLMNQGQVMQAYLQNGTLPPGAQAAIDQASAAATASIRSQYASLGMTGSSAEAQDIANAQQAARTQATNLAVSLFQSGISETQLSAQLYQDIMNNAIQQDQGMSSAIGNLAVAMAGAGLGQSTGGTSAASPAAG